MSRSPRLARVATARGIVTAEFRAALDRVVEHARRYLDDVGHLELVTAGREHARQYRAERELEQELGFAIVDLGESGA